MTEKNLDPLCEMEFIETQTNKKVTARLWAPLFDNIKECYYCISELDGFEEGQRRLIYSDTRFGTLTNSLLRFRVIFERQEGDFRTSDGNSPHMYFPKEIPWVYGSDVYERLCKMVGDEVQKIEDELTKRRENRTRKDET